MKAPQATRMGPPHSPGAPHVVRVDSSPSSGAASDEIPEVQEVEPHADLIQRKRNRVESGSAVGEDASAVRSFGLPPYFKEEGFFEGFPLSVVADEAETIRRMSKEDRRRHLAANMAGLVKMAEMVVVLSEEGEDPVRIEALEQEKAALASSSRKLRTALERSEEMFREQASLLAAEREMLILEKENSGKLAEEGELLRADRERLETDIGRLTQQIEDLKVAMLPAEDEPEDIAALKSRSELVAHIRLLEADCVGAMEEGFDSAVSQLSLLNPGLITEGTGYMYQIVDGAIVPPPDSPVVDNDGSGETGL